MKTRSLARIITAFSVTTLIAIMSFGSTTVFGVAAPVQNPDNSNGVSPTFTGVNITGNSTFTGPATFGDSTTVAGPTTFSGALNRFTGIVAVGDPLGVDLQLFSDTVLSDSLDGLKIWNRNGNGSVKIGGGAFENDLLIAGNLRVGKIGPNIPGEENRRPGNLEVYGAVSNPDADLNLNDSVNIAGRLTVNGDVDMPISIATANISNNSIVVPVKSATAVCPADTIVISCQMIFNGGYTSVAGPGTASLGNLCLGRYQQLNNNLVTGLVQATCL